MRNITQEFYDTVKNTNETAAEIARRTEHAPSTVRGWLCGSREIPLTAAQKILDAIGYELLIFPKDEQFNDRYAEE